MEKQTATEWMFKQLWEEPKDKFTWNAILIKANEIENKNAVLFAKEYDEYLFRGCGLPRLTAEQYYNQTFKKD
jgi:hypothetical protein